jgi:hypothetical protein
MVEHGISLGHCLQLQITGILSLKLRHMDRIIREVREMKLHLNKLYCEDGFIVRKLWKPLVCSLKVIGSLPLRFL